MSNIAQAVRVEMLKVRRSRMLVLTALGFSLVLLVGGFFMIVLKDPKLAHRVGLISAKHRSRWVLLIGQLTSSFLPGHSNGRHHPLWSHWQTGVWSRVFRPHGKRPSRVAHLTFRHRACQVHRRRGMVSRTNSDDLPLQTRSQRDLPGLEVQRC